MDEVEPVPPGVRRLLRAEVRRTRALNGRRRIGPAVLNLGELAGARLVLPADWTDPALGTDLVIRGLERLGPTGTTSAWLTRSGALVAGDLDLAWHAAARAGFATMGVPLRGLVAVTRHGWLDVASSEQVSWARVRGTWRPPPGTDRALPTEPDVVEGWPIRF